MSDGYYCDVCDKPQKGDALVRFKLESTGASHPSEEWCDDCLHAYQEWRASRMPATELEIVAPPFVIPPEQYA